MIPGSEFAPVADNPPDLGAQLCCSDPDDMRAIWRRAALALGATEEEAIHADLVVYETEPDRWALQVPEGDGYRLLIRVRGGDIKHATGALCRAVWGPK